MENHHFNQLFMPLWDDLLDEHQFNILKPLLSHYTSVSVLESILRTNELWLSHPLFMNDLEEVNFGMQKGVHLVLNENTGLDAALETPERVDNFKKLFAYYYHQFATDHVMDTYVFCLSEHDPSDSNGLLSMWRGYGNNGNGVAIVFDVTKVTPVNGFPIFISKVNYATEEQVINWLNNLILKFTEVIRRVNIPDDKLYIAAFQLFERIKLASIFTKHHGFKEEKEWRLVYLKDRDADNKLESMFSYWMGPRGIEPKLKFKLEPIEGLITDLSLTKIVDRIILGPSTSSPKVKATILRMVEKLGHPELKEKVYTSTIPFRATRNYSVE